MTRTDPLGRPLPTPEEAAAFAADLEEAKARFRAAAAEEGGMPISSGWRPGMGPRPAPTPAEVADFDAAMEAAKAKFRAAAAAEGGMPISAGWRPGMGPPAPAPEEPAAKAGTPADGRVRILALSGGSIRAAAFTLDLLDLSGAAKTFKALGNPVRLRIVEALAAGPLDADQITARVGPAVDVARHLTVLRNARIVRKKKAKGRGGRYALRPGLVEVGG